MSRPNNLSVRAKNLSDDVLYELEDLPRSCAVNRAAGMRGLEIDNWLGLALRCIELLGVRLRHFEDQPAAQTALRKARWAATQAVDAFDYYLQHGSSPNSPLFRSYFDSGFVVAWLARDMALAERFAVMSERAELSVGGGEGDFGTASEIATMMFAALARDDAATFHNWKKRFDHEVDLIGDQDPYWKTYYIYADMMQAVMARDGDSLLAMFADAERRFVARSSDKRAVNLPMAEGPPPLNSLLIDFRATALGQLALLRGIHIDFESPAVPLRTIANWPELGTA